MYQSLRDLRQPFGGRPALFMNKADLAPFKEKLGSRLAADLHDRLDGRGASVYGVEVWFSEFVPTGQVIVVDPSGRPIPVPIRSWSEVVTTITALGLAGVDERVGG